MERSPAIAGLFTRASAVAAALGLELREGSAGGGSDGNFTAALGVPTLDGLGAIGDGAHAAHEHVDIPSLAWRAALLAGILTSLSSSA
jgi:glutamate carboxypeptidase